MNSLKLKLQWFFHQLYGIHRNYSLILIAFLMFAITSLSVFMWFQPNTKGYTEVIYPHYIQTVEDGTNIITSKNYRPEPISVHHNGINPFLTSLPSAITIDLLSIFAFIVMFRVRNVITNGYRADILIKEGRENLITKEDFIKNYK